MLSDSLLGLGLRHRVGHLPEAALRFRGCSFRRCATRQGFKYLLMPLSGYPLLRLVAFEAWMLI
jgi:hypothetical protein